MSRKQKSSAKVSRRRYDDDFKREAVQMLYDGHSAQSIADRLGISSTNLLYKWKKEELLKAGEIGSTLEARVKELENELRRTQRERDVLKKALIIFGRHE